MAGGTFVKPKGAGPPLGSSREGVLDAGAADNLLVV